MTASSSTDINTTINSYNDRLRALNIEKSIEETRAKFKNWYDESIATVENFYKQKCNELDQYVKQIKTQFDEKRSKIQTCFTAINDEQKKNEQDSAAIKQNCDSISQLLNEMEKLLLRVNTNSLNISENSIQIVKNSAILDLTYSLKYLPYSSDSSSAIACNDRYFLMHQYPYLCLIDRDLKIVSQRPWCHEWIRDMCWSPASSAFILITDHSIFFYNEQLMDGGSINLFLDGGLFSCTCSQKSLYVSTCQWGSTICELDLFNPVTMFNNWKPPLTCGASDGINDIKYKNNKLALLIKDSKEYIKRMDVKSIEDFSTIFSISLSVGPDIRLFTCCVLPFDEWLVVDGTNSHIYHISNDGRFRKAYSCYSVPYRAILFGSNSLALGTEHDLRFLSY